MKDAKDKKTTDAFKRPVGRPSTSTPEEKRELAAERQRQFRLRKKAENALFKGVMAGDVFAKDLARAMNEKPMVGYSTFVKFKTIEDDFHFVRLELDFFITRFYAVGKSFFEPEIITIREI